MADINPVNNPMGALQQMATAPMNQLLAQQQQGHAQHQAQLQNVQSAIAAAPEADEAERWGAMAMGAAKTPPMTGGFGMMLANIGGAYGQTLAAQKQREVERQAMLAKLMEAGQLGAGSMTAMTQAALNPYLNVPGVGLVRRTDASMALPSNMVPEYNKLYSAFYKEATEQKMPNPEEWARQQATAQLGYAAGAPSIAGGRAAQFTEGRAETAPAPQDFDVKLKPGTDTEALVKQLKFNENKAVAEQDFARAKELQALRLRVEAGGYQTTASPLEYKDKPRAAMEEKQAEGAGKRLQEEAGSLNAAASASSDLKIQLGQLSELFKTPNLPEGAFGEKLQTIRSGLGSLGLLDKEQMKTVAAGDLVTAIGGKLSLLTRTADGSNLMPGAMSDFEQKILRSLAPGLGQSAEGRAALTEFLTDMADIRIRMAGEANKLTDDRGILSPEWFKRKERLLKEEQARMALKARELKKRFNVQGE